MTSTEEQGVPVLSGCKQIRSDSFFLPRFIVLNYVYVWVCAHEYRHLYYGSQRHQAPMELEV